MYIYFYINLSSPSYIIYPFSLYFNILSQNRDEGLWGTLYGFRTTFIPSLDSTSSKPFSQSSRLNL